MLKNGTSHDSKQTSSKCRIAYCSPFHPPQFDHYNNIRCTVLVTSCKTVQLSTISDAHTLSKLHNVQLSTISSAHYLSQAPHSTIINNIRCTVPVTSCILYNYQQYPVHSPCHKLHNVQLSTVSGAQSLSQAPHRKSINNIRCRAPVTSSTLYS